MSLEQPSLNINLYQIDTDFQININYCLQNNSTQKPQKSTFYMQHIPDFIYPNQTFLNQHQKRDSIKSIETNSTQLGEKTASNSHSLENITQKSLQSISQTQCADYDQNWMCLDGSQCAKGYHHSTSLGFYSKKKNLFYRIQNFPEIFVQKDKRTRSFLYI